jgi:hypothetical protein
MTEEDFAQAVRAVMNRSLPSRDAQSDHDYVTLIPT